MIINRHTLHCLLVDYRAKKSEFRSAIEKIRGDLAIHEKENYRNFYSDLSPKEMGDLIQTLRNFIHKNKIHPVTKDNNHLMMHQFMCQCLLAYELDFPLEQDPLRKIVDFYFIKLNKEMHLTTYHSSLKTWMQHLIQFPHLYIDQIFVGGYDNEYRFQDLNLTECGCIDVSHDRLLSDIRMDVEKQILDQCLQRASLLATNPLNILSFGSGGGLQDFLLIYKLFSLGIKNIAITLVEFEYNSLLNPRKRSIQIWDKNWDESKKIPEKYLNDNQDHLYSINRALSLLIRIFPEAQLIIRQYDSIRHLNKDSRYDVIYGIDIDESSSHEDFYALAKNLKDEGTAILSAHYNIKNFVKIDNVLKEIFSHEYKPTEFNKQQGGYIKKRLMNKAFFYHEPRGADGLIEEKPSRFLK
ncbi:MAG TPA: hypothetical protein VHM20_08050 [Gammaproteobacteria bacterium]|jgi:glutaredoxin|nr:hypothetical protein [Gammaproteobacteria bacterium]